MDQSWLAVATAAVLIGGGAAGTLAWMLATARGRALTEAAVRASEVRAGAATAKAEALGEQARQAEGRANALEAALRQVEGQRSAEAARAEGLARNLEEQRALLDGAKVSLGDTFQALAGEALRASQEDFLALASERFGAVRKETSAELEARQQAQQKAIEGMVGPVSRLARESGCASAGDGAGARHGVWRPPPADGLDLRDAGEAARRDRQPGDRAQGARGAWAMGRDAAPAGRRAGRDAGALRLRGAGDRRRRRRTAAPGHGGQAAGRGATSSSTPRRRSAPTWRRWKRRTTKRAPPSCGSTPCRFRPTSASWRRRATPRGSSARRSSW